MDGKPRVKRTMVVAGRDEALVREALAQLERYVKPDHIRRFDAQETSVRALMSALAEPSVFAKKEMVVFDALAPRHELRLLEEYANNPIDNVVLVLTANRIHRPDGERWIPSNKKVQYVDCNSATEGALLKMCAKAGVWGEDGQWLVEWAAGDPAEIVQALRLCEVFPKPWPEGLIREVVPPSTRVADMFEEYVMLPSATDQQLVTRLQQQLSKLALMRTLEDRERTPLLELAARLDMETFVVKRLLPLAQEVRLRTFVERSDLLGRYAKYAGQPRFPEFLRVFM